MTLITCWGGIEGASKVGGASEVGLVGATLVDAADEFECTEGVVTFAGEFAHDVIALFRQDSLQFCVVAAHPFVTV